MIGLFRRRRQGGRHARGYTPEPRFQPPANPPVLAPVPDAHDARFWRIPQHPHVHAR